MQQNVRRSGSRIQCHQRSLSHRHLCGPVVRMPERLLQAWQHFNRRRTRRLLTLDQRLVDADGHVPPKDLERSLALQMQWSWSSQRAFHFDFEETGGTALELQLRMKLCDEEEGIKLDQHVVPNLPVNAKAGRRRIQLRTCTELDGIRRQREVGFTPNARVIPGGQIDGDTFQLGKVWWWLKGWMQTSHGEGEVR